MLFSCATKEHKHEAKNDDHISADTTKDKDTLQNQVPVKASGTLDTLIIDSKAAVFYQPDSLQMAKRMKEVGEENFRAGKDDYLYSMNTSAEYLERQGVPIVDAKGRKFLKFMMVHKKSQLIKLDTLKELWGLYLFTPQKKPYSADLNAIEDDYKRYFR